MNVAALILEYFKVVLSAPTVAGAFAFLFRKEIANLIGRGFRLKLPGGSELYASQQERAIEEKPPKQLRPPADEVELPATFQVTEEQARQVQELIRSERANAALWEYRYLNFYLVRSTQLVLDWIGRQQQTVSIRLLDSIFLELVPSPVERNAILTALQNHHLVTIAGDAVQITEKGKEYREWRGPIMGT